MKQILLHILLLTTTSTFDAWTTRRGIHQYGLIGWEWHERNPVGRPFVQHQSLYVLVPAANVGIYALLRKTKHPKLAAAYAYTVSGAHATCAVRNLVKTRQDLRAWRGQVVPGSRPE